LVFICNVFPDYYYLHLVIDICLGLSEFNIRLFFSLFYIFSVLCSVPHDREMKSVIIDCYGRHSNSSGISRTHTFTVGLFNARSTLHCQRRPHHACALRGLAML